MAKEKVAHEPTSSQLEQNPQVLIRYNPENALPVLASSVQAITKKVEATNITGQASLKTGSEVLVEGEQAAQKIETFLASLRDRVREAAERFRDFPGFEDFTVSLTVTQWALRKKLETANRALKDGRASFLAAEDRRQRQEQADRDAEQRRINQADADAAAKTAKKEGADAETIADIRSDVMATPAPIVQSKAIETARAAGVGLRYSYKANITDLKALLGYCLTNDVFFNTLKGAAEADIEDAFHKMAGDQKEAFNYPGITFDKVPVDVSRRR